MDKTPEGSNKYTYEKQTMVYMKDFLRQSVLDLRKLIVQDLQTKDFNKDPFGFCNYLLFLLEKKLEHEYLDDVVHWMNAFIRDVIVDKKISRSADNEITTAIFGHYILAKHNRLTTKINTKQINEVLKDHIDHKGLYFKQNITYTICLVLGLYSERKKIKNWNKTRNALYEEYKNKNLHCDPKNLCYYILLLEIEKNTRELQKLSKWVADVLIDNKINTHDKPYYLWMAWRSRKYIKKDLKIIKNKIANCLENFLIDIETEEEPQSKIIKSLYYDIAKSFLGRTVLISFDEYHEPNFFAKIGGFFVGLVLLILAIISIYYSHRFGLLSYANLTLISTISFKSFLADSAKLIMSIVLLIFEVYILFMGGIILWEVPIKDRYQRQEILQILKVRSNDYFKWAFLIVVGQLIMTPFMQ